MHSAILTTEDNQLTPMVWKTGVKEMVQSMTANSWRTVQGQLLAVAGE